MVAIPCFYLNLEDLTLSCAEILPEHKISYSSRHLVSEWRTLTKRKFILILVLLFDSLIPIIDALSSDGMLGPKLAMCYTEGNIS